MRKWLAGLCMVAASGATSAQVGVAITVGQPGFYGQILIGNAPPPVLVYPQPVMVQPAPGPGPMAPVYLHVPPGHAKHWAKHCHEYQACGRPVYFVDGRWYDSVYVPYHQREHGRGEWREHDRGREHGKGHGRNGER